MYGDLLNETQSNEITCSSRYLQGSIYHRIEIDITTVNLNPMDMVHCEASADELMNLNLYYYYHAKGYGIRSLSSQGPCIVSDAVNCTRLILYLNLSYYDSDDDGGRIIPVCALTRASPHNSECLCIHYDVPGEIVVVVPCYYVLLCRI